MTFVISNGGVKGQWGAVIARSVSNEAIQFFSFAGLRSLSPGAHSRDPLANARNDVWGLCPLLRPHQIGKALEQIMGITRTWRSFRMILHGKYRLSLERNPAIGAVEQRDVGLRRALRQRRLIDREA